MRTDSLSLSEARRVALSAQGLAEARPTGAGDRRHARRILARVGAIQVDAVNVIARSQELALWSRLGVHRRDLLPSMIADGELFEYWGHEASLLPVERHRLFRFKMAAPHQWAGVRQANRGAQLEALLVEIRDRGPLSASELSTPSRKVGPWWGWDDAKRDLECLFWQGRLTARRRPTTFERVYDLPERVLPAAVLNATTPEPDEARKDLLELAARHHGVGTARDLADYYRLRLATSRPLLTELVEAGRLLAIRVDGWNETAYLHPAVRIPRAVEARTLVSPFDSLVWERQRTERLFGFTYRIGIYTPAAKRVHGYYVLPFVLGDRLVARVDVKADRAAGALRVPAAFAEPGQPPEAVADALADELHAMAGWLCLDRLEPGSRGDLADALSQALIARRGR